jgi:glucokinase-like ROK family protein
VDLGATHLNTVITNLRGQVQANAETEFDLEAGPEAGLARVHELVQRTMQQVELAWSKVWAVGMGVPGPVVAARGMVSSPPLMPGWDGFPIREQLEAYWQKPTFVDNDADLGALGEGTFGAGRGEPNLAYIKIGTGIGCGILLDGKIYHGVLGTAGEIGHVTVSQDGPPCKCGNYGCLEAMAGGRAIAQRARMAVQANQPTTLAMLNHGHQLTAQDVSVAAQAGDAVSQQLLSDAGRHIGSALASLVNLLNPGLIIIGGRVAEAGPYILNPIREAVKHRSLRASYDATRILPATLGEQSVAMGAVALALDNGLRAVLYADKLKARQLRPHLSA